MLKVFFSKIKKEAKIPTKRREDNCYDIYACFEEDYIEIKPMEIKSIPTGIASACPVGYGFSIKERGSTGKIGLSKRSGEIDSGYRGEWFLNINNTNNKTLRIDKSVQKIEETEDLILYPYTKAVASARLVKIYNVELEEIPYEDLLRIKSERGINCLGSSGK